MKTLILFVLFTCLLQGADAQGNNFRGISLQRVGKEKVVFVKEGARIKIMLKGGNEYEYDSRFTILNDSTLQFTEGVVNINNIKGIRARRAVEPLLGSVIFAASSAPITLFALTVNTGTGMYGENILGAVIGAVGGLAMIVGGITVASIKHVYPCDESLIHKWRPSIFIGNPDSLINSATQEQQLNKSELIEKERIYYYSDSIRVLKLIHKENGKITHVSAFNEVWAYYRDADNRVIRLHGPLLIPNDTEIIVDDKNIKLNELIKIRSLGAYTISNYDLSIETIKNEE